MKTYEVTLHRVIEHETIYRVKANDEEEAEELVLTGDYDEVISDSEIGDMKEYEELDIKQV